MWLYSSFEVANLVPSIKKKKVVLWTQILFFREIATAPVFNSQVFDRLGVGLVAYNL